MFDKYLNDSEKKMIFNAVVRSQFSCCPLVWMFFFKTNKQHDQQDT